MSDKPSFTFVQKRNWGVEHRGKIEIDVDSYIIFCNKVPIPPEVLVEMAELLSSFFAGDMSQELYDLLLSTIPLSSDLEEKANER